MTSLFKVWRYLSSFSLGISFSVFHCCTFLFLASSYLAAGVQAVIGDDAFHTESTIAASVLRAAKELNEWLKRPENQPSAEEFSSLLLSSVKACVARDMTSTRSREKMWSSYHQLRCSAAYISRWQCFLKQSLGVEGHPILFQSIGNAVLEKLVKEKCPVSQTAGAEEQPEITMQELNALRYAAGYIPRALSKKLKKSAHPLKDQLQLCLLDLLDDGDEEGGTAEEWLNLIDRGSLKHINESTFQVMVAMELELRKHLQSQKPPNFVHKIMEHILKNENVQFHWSIVACDWEEEAEALLQQVVKVWVTMRGFSYASAWVVKIQGCQCQVTSKVERFT